MDQTGQLWTGIACHACSGCHDLYLADDREYSAGIKMAYRCPATGRNVEWSTHSAFESVTRPSSNAAELMVA